MSAASYDVLIIGSGPGGYIAAVRCGQLGLKTAIIEKYPTLGGTCLNVGCIPSKAVLESTELYQKATHQFAEHGIDADNLRADLPRLMARKDQIVSKVCDGVVYLMKKNKVDVIQGVASFVDATTVQVAPSDGGGGEGQQLTAKNIIIATGSKPSTLPFITLDKERIITSTEALALRELPKHLIIVGGGVIGLELGSVYARLGSQVSVVEYTDAIIPTMDRTLGKELLRSLKKQGLAFYLSHKVTAVTREGETVKLTATPAAGGADLQLAGDYCLVSVGRRPYTDGLNLAAAGVELDEKGRVKVNDELQTNVPGIWALGDVVRGAMLAHKASDEGVFVAERIAGHQPHVNYLLIPGVVYTWPEVAGVGYTEEQLKESGTAYKVGTFPYSASGRALAGADTEGLVKVLTAAGTDEILGVHMIGARIADIIAEAVAVMSFRGSAEDVGIMSHAHPTYAEAFKEASLNAAGIGALNM
ncbi:dihydrolipoyl dehydrogenase [Hymenobacter sp. BT175]|uniref:dihydrolipoyl dehydrogenase n=1 Tax=Hymenobacter TaxID=89966 RepID=UPI00165157F3|nr:MULTISPECIES: dihydrolipoyl dehydrogenase [Hymenobacter]MBC6700280.1 dihydrolipoyl dehydrogenase [Hymenobacter sp. BT190]MCC2548736.1 dihydrolipoyl dehydrogenase [Hymenobacter translucens]MCR5890509.1 dihydrolipoyl dehydrogenase [Hymenobacter sp. J193]MCR5890604.1 dihydrolipoyl dehydrogenase [Hymenobacter sp. J193]